MPGERFLPASFNPFSRSSGSSSSNPTSNPNNHDRIPPPAQPASSSSSTLLGSQRYASSSTSGTGTIPMTDPHRFLSEILATSHIQRDGRFSNSMKAALMRSLFQCIWQKQDWIKYFLPPDEDITIPSFSHLNDWLMNENDTFITKSWSLKEAQDKADASLLAKGKGSIRKVRNGTICGKVLNRFERTFTCKTCAINPSVVLCADCFQASNHEGHEVLFGQSYSFSASCDCGDPSAWRSSATINGNLNPGKAVGCSHHPPLAKNEKPTQTLKYEIPDNLLLSIHRTIVIILEFIIQTLQHSLLPSEYSSLPKTETELRDSDNPTGEAKERRSRGPWSVVMWQDEKHVLNEMTRQLRDALGIKWEVAEQWIREVDEVGRKVVLVSPNPVVAFHAANMIQQIDAPVSLRLALDTYREELVGVLISWLNDMVQCTVDGDDTVFKRMLAKALYEPRLRNSGVGAGTPLSTDLKDLEWGKIMGGHDTRRIDWLLQLDSRLWKKAKWEMRQIYCSVLLFDQDVRKDLASRFAMNYPRLVEHYLFQDRELDTNIIYSSAYLIFTNGAVCVHATTKGQLYNNVINVAHAWYTGQVIKTDGCDRLVVPPNYFDQNDPSAKGRMDVEVPAFRSKKGLALLGHLRSMVRYPEMRKLVVRQPQLFNRVLSFINMFVGLQPQRREQEEHVEYEVDWYRSFIILPDMAKLCREVGEIFQSGSPDNVLGSMVVVVNRILTDMMLMSNTLDKEKYKRPIEHDVQDVLYAGSRFSLIKQSISKIEAFSFHHFLNFLLAEMVKSSKDMFDPADGKLKGLHFKEVIEQFVLRANNPSDSERMKLLVIEWSIQTHVVLSQIRADMWKKNGAAMRMQHHHYREMTVREATIDQDFFILQLGLTIIDPLKFMVALIERYGLAQWFRGNPKNPDIWLHHSTEPKQRINLLEDFLLLVIHLVSYPAIIDGWSRDKITRKHIIHQLAVQPLTYSEIYKKLPERSQETSVTPILRSVADFREPTESSPGQYSLKDDLYDEIDPYWHYYTKNDQRGAMDHLVARAKKRNPSQSEEPLILPRPLELPRSGQPFSTIGDFLHTTVVSDIVYWTLSHCLHIGSADQWALIVHAATPAEIKTSPVIPTWDFVLDYTLHLIMIALSVAPKEFAENSLQIKGAEGDHSTFQNLWLMQTHTAYKPYKARVDYILDMIVKNLPMEYTVDYRANREAENLLELSSPTRKTDPKAAAAARQKAIMAAFAKQQQDFAAMMDDESGEEDESMMAEDETINEGEETYGQCIVCQEDITPRNPGGMMALLQPSRTLREAVHDRDWLEESLLAPTCLDKPTRYHRFAHEPIAATQSSASDPITDLTSEPSSTQGYPSSALKFGVNMSACSHYMHESCMANYFDATKTRHTQQVQRHHPENAVRLEYMCPLCKSLGNVLIPVESSATIKKTPIVIKKDGEKPPSLSQMIRRVSSEGLLRVADSQRIWDHHFETGEVIPWFSDCVFSVHSLDHVHRRGNMRSTSRMADRMRGLIRPLSEQSQRIRGKKTHIYLPDDLVGYTVSMSEITQRGLGGPTSINGKQVLSVAEQIPELQLKLIKKLIGLLQLELDLYFGPNFDRTALRVGIFARFLPDWYRSSTLPSPLLLRRPLGMIVECAAIAPDLLQSVIVMAYFAELTRTMLGLSLFIKKSYAHPLKPPSPRSTPPEDETYADGLELFEGFRGIMLSVLRNAGPFADAEGVLNVISDEALSKLLYSHTLPFLRRAAIIYYAVSNQYPVSTPSNLEMIQSGNGKMSEYKKLLILLGIPSPKETLIDPTTTETPIVARWLTQWAHQGRILPTLEYPGTYELIRLPLKWEDLILKYQNEKCKKCKTKPTYPALCLFCGELLCLGGDCCSFGEEGECNLHMRECGAVVGMFVDIRRWVILYLYAGSGSFGHMPYLDQHGELDISMRRGHRQYVHIGRLDELRKATWLMHTIPHLTARKLELTSDGGGWGCL
uniref:E3 ubiquitin-protein ligase n=1 Tax=Kwoniella pini CBS 10737 TaxID=1296096 RepID=A0A1B9I3Y0_9TREE|nr:ubiquitin-protein ligase [Kwoniella pini CBS 10737]OCF50224.1 ubiquitin-protein ligase [Kwoniella pini CBS 10737]